ncbi:DUF805 domain-containing protein [Bifidobacterium sp.]|uniref:DUF805 domain-containing protein n=1 Tax=Bifidobacterium sp. TaxID=41200 RepID=UPI003D7D5D28
MTAPDQYGSQNPYNPYGSLNMNTSPSGTTGEARQSQQYDSYYATSGTPVPPPVVDYAEISRTHSLDLPAYGCNIADANMRFWKKFLDTKGRASRSEFWWCLLTYWLLLFAFGVLIGLSDIDDRTSNIVETVAKVVLLVPFITLSVRRLHDSGRDGKVLVTLLVVSGIGNLLGRFGGLTLGMGALRAIGGDGSMSGVHTGIGVVIIALLLIVAAPIAYLIFMALPSDLEGARFDEMSIERMEMAASMRAGRRPQTASGYSAASNFTSDSTSAEVRNEDIFAAPQPAYSPRGGTVFAPQGMAQPTASAAPKLGAQSVQPSPNPFGTEWEE